MRTSDAMRVQARALADPTRFHVFSVIASMDRPLGVAELTERFALNHNAIRQHLAVLVEAGLVHESDEVRTTRGRPRKQYELRADALSEFAEVAGSYRSLADLLLEVVTSGDSPYDVGRRFGEQAPLEASGDSLATTRQLMHRLALEGFEPSSTGVSGSIRLARCPFADVAAKEPGIVCEIHRGIVDGHLSAHPGPPTTELRLRPPHRGGCQVIVSLG